MTASAPGGNTAAVSPGDVVGIGIHTGHALRGYAIGQITRARGAWVVFGGIHATLCPDEAHERGSAHAVVGGDGDVVWQRVGQRARGASTRWARWLGLATRRLFLTTPMPQLQVPEQPTAPPVRLLTIARR